MKVIYCEHRRNGTYRYVHRYIEAEAEAAAAIRRGADVTVDIVPDGWGEPGFIDWTDDQRLLAQRHQQAATL